MAASEGRINFKAKAFVDRPAVIKAIGKWQLSQLSRVGAYARGAMKKQIRPALKGRKKDRRITIHPLPGELPATWRGNPRPIDCFLDDYGRIVRAGTNNPVPRAIERRARMELRGRKKGQGEGKPPRRGPTDNLRRHIYFSVDTRRKSVVVGPEPFPKQPPMVKRVSVPELLNKGGIEVVAGERVKYGPRPFIETIMKPALAKLKENIEKKPVGR